MVQLDSVLNYNTIFFKNCIKSDLFCSNYEKMKCMKCKFTYYRCFYLELLIFFMYVDPILLYLIHLFKEKFNTKYCTINTICYFLLISDCVFLLSMIGNLSSFFFNYLVICNHTSHPQKRLNYQGRN